jgi:hypothetical protein
MLFDTAGSQMRELSFLKGVLFHVYGLVAFEHLLFYSDWYSNGVYMVDTVTGYQQPIATHLSRPTALVIYHPANLTGRCRTEWDKSIVCWVVFHPWSRYTPAQKDVFQQLCSH